MTLSEIETTIDTLLARHPDLTQELLTTLLTSSNWEEKNIKEAHMLFEGRALVSRENKSEEAVRAQHAVVENMTVSKAQYALESDTKSGTKNQEEHQDNIVFYTPDGEQEKDVQVEEASDSQREESVKIKDIKEMVPLVKTKEQKIEELNEESLVDSTEIKSPSSGSTRVERVSLLEEETPLGSVSTTQEKDIPLNLPLLPFESSPHVWSFSRYKDVFHKEEKKEVVSQPEVVPAPFFQDYAAPISHVYHKNTNEINKDENPKEIEEISIEETPLTKSDESLVFLAGAMLIAVLIILGYMYGNGRL